MSHLATAERICAMAPALYYIGIAIDAEYEKTGTVSPLVIEQLRNVLNEPSSTKKRGPELSAACSGEMVGFPAGFPQPIDCTASECQEASNSR